MKTKSIIAILLICAANLLIANPKKWVNESSKTISVVPDYNKISVAKNISIEFVEMSASMAVIKGDNKLLTDIDIKVVDGTLFITSKRYVAPNSITIYLPTKDLAEINLQENAKIHNKDAMTCENLTVYFKEGSHASLTIQGKVEFKASADIEIIQERSDTFYSNWSIY